jgi:hypothetical protein
MYMIWILLQHCLTHLFGGYNMGAAIIVSSQSNLYVLLTHSKEN